jgi:hypothetical protein
MPSEYLHNAKATFNFHGDSCSEELSGWLNYVDPFGTGKGRNKGYDKTKDVKFKGFVTSAGICEFLEEDFLPGCLFDQIKPWPLDPGPWGCPEDWFIINFDYSSTNSANWGDGHGFSCVKQGSGKGRVKGNEAYMFLFSGPFQWYENGPGTLQGHVSMSECPSAD